jgi:hypothetical protein
MAVGKFSERLLSAVVPIDDVRHIGGIFITPRLILDSVIEMRTAERDVGLICRCV